MGLYINLGNDGFQSARNGEYVDKSDLIRVVNNTLNTELRFSCVSRCRRFGKSMAAKMLCAYYDQSCESNSVIQALDAGRCRSFWASTGAFDAVANYIQMNYEGLKDDIILMLSGGRCKVNTTMFQNDMSVVSSRDDVLTVLIHLGYLSYDWRKEECYIPNREVAGEMANAVEANNWKNVVDALKQSEQLLQATLQGDAEAVACGVDAAHDEHTSILSYNNENSLACVLSLAYYYARNDYVVHRELPTGKGFADLVLIPRKRSTLSRSASAENVDSPALVIELKYDKAVDTAIDQIKRRHYTAKVQEYAGHHLLLVGICYDRETKQHTCRIEPFTKE